MLFPGFSRTSNPGLKLANAFGVISKLMHYQVVDYGLVLRSSVSVT